MNTRQFRDQRALDALLNDDGNEQNRLDKSLVNMPRPFRDEALARLARRQRPAEPKWEQGIPLPGREPPQQQEEQQQQRQENRFNNLEQLTAQTILNPATSKDVTVHFDMDVTDDISYLLEEFSRLKRLGDFQAAAQYFDENLRDFADVLPVVIEYADMLVEQGAYQRLKDFLRPHNEVLQWTSKIDRPFTDEERETLVYQANLQLINAVASMHLTGNIDRTYGMVLEVRKTARAILNSRSPVFEPLDSAEVQVFRYALKVLSRIEKETDSVPESDFDFWVNCHHLYRPLIATGQVWDARDLICALIDSEGASNTWNIIFRTDIKSSDAFTKLLADWDMVQYDESTYLAIFDILVHASNQLSSLIFAAPSSENLSLAARCLNHARDIATCLKENNPDLVHCRSYLSWILAETQLRRKRHPTGSDLGTHLSGYPGLTVWTNTLPIYLPIRSENPTWCSPSDPRDRNPTSNSELLEAASETSRGREDYATEVACLAELIYHGVGGPEDLNQRFSRMYSLQSRYQRDILNAQHTCLTRFLTRTNDPGRRALLTDINELQQHIPDALPNTLTLTSWCMQVIEKSLRSQTSRPMAQPPFIDDAWSSARNLPQYVKDQLTARGLGRSYGLNLDDVDTFRRRRTPHRSRSPDLVTLHGPTDPVAPRRRGFYKRERSLRDRDRSTYDPSLSPKVVPSIVNPARPIPDPVAYPGSESDSGYERPSDVLFRNALVRRERGPVGYHRSHSVASQDNPEGAEYMEKQEHPEDAKDSGSEIKPPVRQNTVEIADESEVEEAGEV